MTIYFKRVFFALIVYLFSQISVLANPMSIEADRANDYYMDEGIPGNSVPDEVAIITLILAYGIIFNWYAKESKKIPQNCDEWVGAVMLFTLGAGIAFGLIIYPVWGIYMLLNWLF